MFKKTDTSLTDTFGIRGVTPADSDLSVAYSFMDHGKREFILSHDQPVSDARKGAVRPVRIRRFAKGNSGEWGLCEIPAEPGKQLLRHRV